MKQCIKDFAKAHPKQCLEVIETVFNERVNENDDGGYLTFWFPEIGVGVGEDDFEDHIELINEFLKHHPQKKKDIERYRKKKISDGSKKKGKHSRC